VTGDEVAVSYVTFDCLDVERVSTFWRQLLDLTDVERRGPGYATWAGRWRPATRADDSSS
jgi:hypothetical protein